MMEHKKVIYGSYFLTVVDAKVKHKFFIPFYDMKKHILSMLLSPERQEPHQACVHVVRAAL